ncbi:hypothetical protein EI555_020779, partial [Monodon monoceros]
VKLTDNHKHLINFHSPCKIVKQITSISTEPRAEIKSMKQGKDDITILVVTFALFKAAALNQLKLKVFNESLKHRSPSQDNLERSDTYQWVVIIQPHNVKDRIHHVNTSQSCL